MSDFCLFILSLRWVEDSQAVAFHDGILNLFLISNLIIKTFYVQHKSKVFVFSHYFEDLPRNIGAISVVFESFYCRETGF